MRLDEKYHSHTSRFEGNSFKRCVVFCTIKKIRVTHRATTTRCLYLSRFAESAFWNKVWLHREAFANILHLPLRDSNILQRSAEWIEKSSTNLNFLNGSESEIDNEAFLLEFILLGEDSGDSFNAKTLVLFNLVESDLDVL